MRNKAKPSLSAASLEEDLKGINQQMNAKQTTETILEEMVEPQQIAACWDSAPHGKEKSRSNVCFNAFLNGFSVARGWITPSRQLQGTSGSSGLGDPGAGDAGIQDDPEQPAE